MIYPRLLSVLGFSLMAAGAGVAATVSAPVLDKFPLSQTSQQKPSTQTDLEFRKGLSAYNGGDYTKAMGIWLPLAEHEDAPSQAGLGFMYHRGLGVAIDHSKAFYWLSKAAEHGQAEGQLMLGSLYYNGQGVPRSYIWAFAWCDLAQDNGNSDAEACRNSALQSLRSKGDVKEAFRLSLELHHRLWRQH